MASCRVFILCVSWNVQKHSTENRLSSSIPSTPAVAVKLATSTLTASQLSSLPASWRGLRRQRCRPRAPEPGERSGLIRRRCQGRILSFSLPQSRVVSIFIRQPLRRRHSLFLIRPSVSYPLIQRTPESRNTVASHEPHEPHGALNHMKAIQITKLD